MVNIELKVKDFGNYLLNICDNEDKKQLIKVLLLNQNFDHILLFVKLLRVQNDEEDKSVVELDENKNEKIVRIYSQVNEWINIFSLKKDDEEVKNKLNEYLNVFLTYKKELNL